MESEALELALTLYRAPIQRHALSSMELPRDINFVIQLASAPQPLLHDTAVGVHESEEFVLEAARFFLQQALFVADASAYRVLGLPRDAPFARVREHHRLLQRWLHPDRRGEDWEALFATRVNWAWANLRNETVRDAYDIAHDHDEPAPVPLRSNQLSSPERWGLAQPAGERGRTGKHIAIGISLCCCVALVYAVFKRDEALPTEEPAIKYESVPAPAIASRDDRRVPAPTNSSGLAAVEREQAPVPAAAPGSGPPAVTALAPPRTVAPQMPEAESALSTKAAGGATGVEAIAATPDMRTEPAAASVSSPQEPQVRRQHSAQIASSNSSPEANRIVRASVSRPTAETPSNAETGRAQTMASAGAAPRRPESGETGSAGPSGAVAVREQAIPVSTESIQGADAAIARTVASAARDEPAAQPASVNTEPSADALLRIGLARERVRELARFFGDAGARSPPVWNDTGGQTSAEWQRSALHERSRLHRAGDFSVDAPVWKMSDNAALLSADYRLSRGRDTSESGHFSLSMVWRERMWLVTHVELEPAL